VFIERRRDREGAKVRWTREEKLLRVERRAVAPSRSLPRAQIDRRRPERAPEKFSRARKKSLTENSPSFTFLT